MSKHLERDLEHLEQVVLAQAAVVEGMIRTACKSLCERRTDLVWEILEKEALVNQREVTIEEECLKILALHQPVAVDLRRTATMLKINSDLERIADLAVNLSERTQALAAYPTFTISPTFETMVRIAVDMVHQALDSFVRLNVDLARTVCTSDDEVDELNRKVIHELYVIMRDNSDLVEAALHFFSATRHVERIADHATNIAEDVIYLVQGEITRHRYEEANID